MRGLAFELRIAAGVVAAIIGAVICIICLIFVDAWKSMILGVVLGTIVSIINFNIMATAGEKAIEMEPGKAKTKMTINYVIRYAIYIVTLIAAIKVSAINPIGMVLGFFTSILALYLIQVLDTQGNRDKLKKLLRRAK